MKEQRFASAGMYANYDTSTFDSVGELVEFSLDSTKPTEANAEHWATLRRGFVSGAEWWNYYTPSRVLYELQNPPDALTGVRDILRDLQIGQNYQGSRRRVLSRQDHGDELCEMAWAQRDPDGWRRIARTPTMQKVVRIACNCAVNWKKAPRDLWYRGAAVAALADAIESTGSRVEIVGFNSLNNLRVGKKTGKVSVLQYSVKRPEMPCNIGAIALALAEIGFYRGIVLAAVTSAATHKVRKCTGYCAPLPAKLAQEFDIVFDCDVLNLASAREIVKRYAADFTAQMPS